MGNKVYYGEYSLDYWIHLIISKNIVLPEYQRSFTWDEKRRNNLMKSFKDKRFVPPVTIGYFEKDGEKQNLIIDGQQRLTSLLLSRLGYFPNRDAYKKYIRKMEKDVGNPDKNFIDENDDLEQEKEIVNGKNIIKWTFNELLDPTKFLCIEELSNKIKTIDFFDPIDNEDVKINDNFLKNTYLGFCYLVPDSNGNEYQKNYYSSVFRNVNIGGMNLSLQESRKALYYLDNSMEDLFMPKFVDKINSGAKIDFVRYMAILSQYKKQNTIDTLCKGYGGKKDKIEEYYEEFIDIMINKKESDTFYSYNQLFGEKGYETKLDKIGEIIENSGLCTKDFDSIIDYDMYYFGLIYMILFDEKEIHLDRWGEIEEKINNQIKIYKARYLDKDKKPTDEFNEDGYINWHQKNPAALINLRARVGKSIEIYENIMR